MHTRTTDQPVRRGAILLVVLGVAVIVSMIALSALLVNRSTARRGSVGRDGSQAAILARAGLELGVSTVNSDADWRTTYTDGLWVENVALGEGTISIAGYDPTDGDLGDADDDPVTLVSMGSCLLYTSPSPRDATLSRMPSSA